MKKTALLIAIAVSGYHSAQCETKHDEQMRNSLNAVVEVIAEKEIPESRYSFNIQKFDDIRKLFEQFGIEPQEKEEPEKRTVEASGSGFYFLNKTDIVTSGHVVDNAKTVWIRRRITEKVEGQERERIKIIKVKNYKYSKNFDLAVLKVPESDLAPTPLQPTNYNEVRIHDKVNVVGNPYDVGITETQGVISAKDRALRTPSAGGNSLLYIQTDAPMNPGNSGGPMLDEHGNVVGINTAIISPTSSNAGLGFSIPMDEHTIRILKQLSEGKSPQVAYLGVDVQDMTLDLNAALYYDGGGTRVMRVLEDSPAYKSGIKMGDIIISFNNHPVTSSAHLSAMVSRSDSSKSANIRIYRPIKQNISGYKNHKSKTFDLITPLASRSSAKSANKLTSSHNNKSRNQVDIKHISELCITLKQMSDGVVIHNLDSACKNRLREKGVNIGMYIISLNGNKIESISDIDTAIDNYKSKSSKEENYKVLVELKDKQGRVIAKGLDIKL